MAKGDAADAARNDVDTDAEEPLRIHPGADADAASRDERRGIRQRMNDRAFRKFAIGFASALFGGAFWGLSGTCASILFDIYHVDTLWLMSVRQLFAGILFMAVILLFDRKRFFALWRNKHHRRIQLVFTFLGILLNQLFYLQAVRLTNAGTATVLQCLQLVLIMGFTCLRSHRTPRPREVGGLVLAFAGTFLIATGGDPTSLSIPPAGLVAGLLCAASAACITIIPTKILPVYGSTIVTGSAMCLSGIVSTLFVQPWRSIPAFDAAGIEALAVFIVIGSFLAYLLYMQGVKDIGSVRASLIGTVEPVSATVTSVLFLGTVFLPTDILGFVCIIVMVFLTV